MTIIWNRIFSVSLIFSNNFSSFTTFLIGQTRKMKISSLLHYPLSYSLGAKSRAGYRTQTEQIKIMHHLGETIDSKMCIWLKSCWLYVIISRELCLSKNNKKIHHTWISNWEDDNLEFLTSACHHQMRFCIKNGES